MNDMWIVSIILFGGIAVCFGLQRFLWWREDKAWAKMANSRLAAAERGVDTSFMDDMP